MGHLTFSLVTVVLCTVLVLCSSQSNLQPNTVVIGASKTVTSNINADVYGAIDGLRKYSTQDYKPTLPAPAGYTGRSIQLLCRHDADKKMMAMITEVSYKNAARGNYLIFFDATNAQGNKPPPMAIYAESNYTGEIASYEMPSDSSKLIFYWTYTCDTTLRESDKFNQYTCVETVSNSTKVTYNRFPVFYSFKSDTQQLQRVWNGKGLTPASNYLLNLVKGASASANIPSIQFNTYVQLAMGRNPSVEPKRDSYVVILYVNGVMKLLNLGNAYVVVGVAASYRTNQPSGPQVYLLATKNSRVYLLALNANDAFSGYPTTIVAPRVVVQFPASINTPSRHFFIDKANSNLVMVAIESGVKKIFYVDEFSGNILSSFQAPAYECLSINRSL